MPMGGSLRGIAGKPVELVAFVEVEALHRVVAALYRARVFAFQVPPGELLQPLVGFDPGATHLQVRRGRPCRIITGGAHFLSTAACVSCGATPEPLAQAML